MKSSEILSDAIGNIDEEMITSADLRRKPPASEKGHKKPGKGIWIRLASAAACIAIIAGIAVLIPRGMRSAALAEAVYPAAARYPGNNEKKYDAWRKQRGERWQCVELIDGRPDDFYKRSAEEFLTGSDSNMVYSPINVYLALAVLAETTGGESRAQLLELLGEDNIDDLRERSKNVWSSNYRNDGVNTSILANSLWLKDGVDYNKSTVNTIAEDHYASVYSGDLSSEKMNKALREWLDKQTGGLLTDSTKDIELDPLTFAAICSTVYFRAKWRNMFSPERNDTKIFHSLSGDKETEFMNGTNSSGIYYAGSDFSAISLGFSEGGNMWFILPDEGKSVDDVISSGEYFSLINEPESWEAQRSLRINYSVPKFDVSSDIDLIDGLKKLGVEDAFQPGKADFTPLTNEALFVSKADHAARVVIDEEGCTAAAYTMLGVSGGGMPAEDEIDFVVDRPFIFSIMSDTQQPLFIGTVVDP